jgi:hypothetical protein
MFANNIGNYLSGAPWLLALPAYIRLGLKGLPRTNVIVVLGSFISYEEKTTISLYLTKKAL